MQGEGKGRASPKGNIQWKNFLESLSYTLEPMIFLHLFLNVIILARHKWQTLHINDCNLCSFYLAKVSACIFSFYSVNYSALMRSILAILLTNTRFLMSHSHILRNEDSQSVHQKKEIPSFSPLISAPALSVHLT